MSSHKKLYGVIPPMMSPVDKNQNIDEQGTRNIVERCIYLGVNGLFLLGTMGEGQSITKEQRKRLIKFTVEQANGRIPILAGISAEGTRKALENLDDAVNAGADYIVTLTPYFFNASDQTELIKYFENIASYSPKPVLIYNNPHMTGNALTIDTIKELSLNPNIVGIKDSAGDFDFHMNLIRNFDDREDFSVFSGMETMCDASLIMGSDGIVAGIGSLIPDILAELYKTAESGDVKGAKSLQNKVLKILDGIYLKGYWAWVVGQKYALSCLGLCQPYFTIDNRNLNDDEKAIIRKTLEEYNIKR